MPAPVVQPLEEIIAQYEPGYANTRNIYNQQIAALPGQYDAQRQAVEGKRVTGFRDIARSANSRGLDFWGTPIEEQNEYLADVYLPGMQAADAAQRKEQLTLQMALAGLDTDIRNNAMGARQQQQSAFTQWQQQQEQMALEREKMAAEQSRFNRQMAAEERANRDPLQEFDAYVAGQFQRSGGAGNKNITRQMQDSWVENWLNQRGVSQGNRQAYWDQINTNYNRNSNKYADWRWKR